MSKPAKPTTHDVAKAAGVSQMTVSRVLRGDASVAPATRDRVEQAVSELGYIPNRLASIQRGAENPMVGVVLPTLANSVFTEVLAGINAGLAEVNLRPVFGVSEYNPEEEERIVRDMLSWQPRGIILTGLEHTDGLRRALSGAGVRVAEIMDTDGTPIAQAFGTSHAAAGLDMAAHLLAQGYRKAGYIAAHGGGDVRANKRYASFRTAFEGGGGVLVRSVVSDHASSMELGRDLAADMMNGSVRPDVVYFSNDDLAAGGLMACIAGGLSVPGDVALAGYNGLPFLDALPQKLTTTYTPRFDIGRAAAAYMAGDRGEQVFAPVLIKGDTT
ncbi:MAG: LacI family DNA-binding transcriptional regulator [Pseudomonadota bacterium]